MAAATDRATALAPSVRLGDPASTRNDAGRIVQGRCALNVCLPCWYTMATTEYDPTGCSRLGRYTTPRLDEDTISQRKHKRWVAAISLGGQNGKRRRAVYACARLARSCR